MRRRAVERIEGELLRRLRARAGAIEEAILAHALAPPFGLDYSEGLRVAVTVAVEHGLDVLAAEGGQSPLAPPPALLLQARLAARGDIGLDAVLRLCASSHALFVDFLAAEAVDIGGVFPRQPLRVLAAAVDCLLEDLGGEYRRERERCLRFAPREMAERVERLLAGEPIDDLGLDYDLQGHHLAVVAEGTGGAGALDSLRGSLDCRLLLIERDELRAWAWFGSREPLDPSELQAQARLPPDLVLALGEPGQGVAGWRLSHRQARAALTFAFRGPTATARYADVALLASISQDPLLSSSLRTLYLAPLEHGRDGGEAARETLRAYFATERNVSSAAALLGVRRHTVARRLQTIEQRLGRPLSTCAMEVELSLRLKALAAEITKPTE
jgi:PucR C-terminal helix-turn-helix domain/GGDEF-like domain